MRIPHQLEPLFEQGLIQEVVRPLMSGKEAAVYIVYADDRYCCAKVYKDAKNRSFKHRSGYEEGRRVRNSRQRRAMEKNSRFGKKEREDAWKNAEVEAIYRLRDAGVRVPEPYLFSDGVLLMELIMDSEGQPAPRLWDIDFSREDACKAFYFLVYQCVLMLLAGLVHGDLSEYNVLMQYDGPVIIDFPQASDAAGNANAKKLFIRDLLNLTQFFTRFAPELEHTHYGEEIWQLYERSELFEHSKLTGTYKGAERKANVNAVLREVWDAEDDAVRKNPDALRTKRGRTRAQAPQQSSHRDSVAPSADAAPAEEVFDFDLELDLDALLLVDSGSNAPSTRRREDAPTSRARRASKSPARTGRRGPRGGRGHCPNRGDSRDK